MKDILRKAEIRKQSKPKHPLNLSHLSPDRNKVQAKEVDEVTIYLA